MAGHSLIDTLKSLRGNVRGCVYTEPLWGIPFNLYAPYVSVYMLAFGLTDSQIGLITTLGLAFQIVWTLLSGSITDKLGRKRTTLIFDIISWSIPCLIWAVAQNFTYFVVAALINSVWRVTHNSWQCLLVEDTAPDQLVDVYSWIYIGGLLAAFVSPLTGIWIARFSLVPTMRGLYLFALVMMTAKFVIMNGMVTETRQGQVRMQETRGQPLLAVLRGSPAVLRQMLRTPATLFTMGLMAILGIGMLIRGTFWSILVTEKLGIPAEHLALYTFARSVVMILFFFLVMPRLRHMDVRKPMIVGFLGLLLGFGLLIYVPAGNYWLLMAATVIEACAFPTVSTLLDTLMVVTIEPRERARIMALFYSVILLFTSPFGWIGGWLSELNRTLPFVLCVALFAAGALLAWISTRLAPERLPTDETAQPEAQEAAPPASTE